METVNAPVLAPETQTADPEAAQWASLMDEMEQAEQGGEVESLKEPEVKEPGTQTEVKEPEQQAKPEPTPAELKTQLDNVNRALKAERAEKQTYVQRLNNYDEFIKQLRESRGQKQETKEPEQPQVPDIEEDPVGHFKARTEQLEKIVRDLAQGTQQFSQQVQQQTEEQRFWAAVEQSEVQERQAAPSLTVEGKQVSDYDLACQHLEATRIAELEMMLPDDSPAAVQAAKRSGLATPADLRMAMLNQDRIAVARHAMALGMSPAKLYYSLAKQRGYQSPTQQQIQQTKGNRQLEAARRGQKAATTISGGGTGTKNELGSLKDLIDLYSEDPSEFDSMWDKMAASGRLG